VRFDSPKKPTVGIDMAPLVDVVFLLVIFFAVSTTFLESAGLKLELPSSTSSSKRETKTLMVTLDDQGQLEFDGEIMDSDQLRLRLAEALNETDDKNVVLRADRHAEHGSVVQVIDQIRECGAEGMTLDAKSYRQAGD
jgi:biopolymer transport protein ExbD